jgi:hypothetical protein
MNPSGDAHRLLRIQAYCVTDSVPLSQRTLSNVCRCEVPVSIVDFPDGRVLAINMMQRLVPAA